MYVARCLTSYFLRIFVHATSASVVSWLVAEEHCDLVTRNGDGSEPQAFARTLYLDIVDYVWHIPNENETLRTTAGVSESSGATALAYASTSGGLALSFSFSVNPSPCNRQWSRKTCKCFQHSFPQAILWHQPLLTDKNLYDMLS